MSYKFEIVVNPVAENIVLSLDGQPADPNNVNSLPEETVGSAITEQDIVASGGTAPYPFDVEGTLPPGVSALSNDVDTLKITGTPTSDGTFDFTVGAVDANGQSAAVKAQKKVQVGKITAPPLKK